jgi:hypothetical protein
MAFRAVNAILIIFKPLTKKLVSHPQEILNRQLLTE